MPLNSSKNHIMLSNAVIRRIASRSTNAGRLPNILTSIESSLDSLYQNTRERKSVSNYRKISAENKPDRALHSNSTNADIGLACEVNVDRIPQEITSNGLNDTPQNESPAIVSSLTPTPKKVGVKRGYKNLSLSLLLDSYQ
ncbi:hypothetical protein GJ496_005473 [Pomphorhynchus laevis]|nr:hypothetical protein GJ496_005473 [Pomphorhynchus laevis]